MSDETPPLSKPRTIAIVGRPNVGKSALFNRLARRRISIVHEQSGVTRDRVTCDVTWDEDEQFELIDTGGLGYFDGAPARGVIDQGIVSQVNVAIEDATILIFVVDVTAGVLPLDEEVARLLHQSGRKVFLAANKADNARLAEGAPAFNTLGFPVFAVSAIQNLGFEPLMDAIVPHLPEAPPPEEIEPLKVAIVGRPNAGKSSYINRLLRNDRVIVSDIPGTTRDSVEIPFTVGKGAQAQHYLLIDTAGIRKRNRLNEAVDKFSMIRTEKSIERADIVVLMVDTVEGISQQDKKISAMITEYEKGGVLMVNKWDLATGTQRQYTPELQASLPHFQHVPVVFISAETGYNIRRSVDAIDYVSAQVKTTVSTGVLNRVLQDAFSRNPPPVKGKHRLKMYYATQVGISPVRIKLFVNNPRRVTANYRAYLMNCLRKAFGLEGAPIVLHFGARNTRLERNQPKKPQNSKTRTRKLTQKRPKRARR